MIPGDLILSATTLRLSEPLTATVVLEGNAPLIVSPPAQLLTEPAWSAWQIRPSGPPKVEMLMDGIERWTQTYALEPFIAGPAVPVEFGTFTLNGQAVSLPKLAVNVRKTIAEDAVPQDYTPPDRPAMAVHDNTFAGPIAAISVAVIIILVAAWLRRKPRQPKPLTPQERLARLEQDFSSPALSALLRDIAGYATATTSEIAAADPVLGTILTRLDAANFAGDDLDNGERFQILSGAKSWLDGLADTPSKPS